MFGDFLELNNIGKFSWFIVAYLPMFAAILIKYYILDFANPIRLFITLLGFLLLTIILFILVNILSHFDDINERPVRFKVKKSSNSEYLLFVVTYLIPFYNLNFAWADLISTIIMLSFIAILYIKSPLFAVNPILDLLGYNLYIIEITDEKRDDILVTHKNLLLDDYEMQLIKFGDGIYITNKLGDEKS